MKKTIELTQEEAATILVGLTEFEAFIAKHKIGYGCYDKTNEQLIEKFRNLCLDFHFDGSRFDPSKLNTVSNQNETSSASEKPYEEFCNSCMRVHSPKYDCLR